jgi:hypothetical protein
MTTVQLHVNLGIAEHHMLAAIRDGSKQDRLVAEAEYLAAWSAAYGEKSGRRGSGKKRARS